MHRRDLIKFLLLSAATQGCIASRIDFLSYQIRSDTILTPEDENKVLAKASVGWTDDNRIRVAYLSGSYYEMGYQQGALLRTQVQSNLGYLYESMLKKFYSKEFFAEVYERIRPFISQKHIDEMHGLAHGAKIPLEVIHAVHALPAITEWGGKKRLKKIIKAQLGTSCSNFSIQRPASLDDTMYTVRILDWGLHRISKLHDYPLLAVYRPEHGTPYLNIGWVGFLGAISGMNAQGITLGEMGYGDPEHETLRGKPMPFLLREVLEDTENLSQVRSLIRTSPGTNSFGFLMSDGKTGEAQLYIKDAKRFLVVEPGEDFTDGDESLPGIDDISYGGHYTEKLTALLSTHRGSITPQLLMEQLIPQVVMKSNFQNVIYDPKNLKLWVSNSSGASSRASEQPYTTFDFGAALRKITTNKP